MKMKSIALAALMFGVSMAAQAAPSVLSQSYVNGEYNYQSVNGDTATHGISGTLSYQLSDGLFASVSGDKYRASNANSNDSEAVTVGYQYFLDPQFAVLGSVGGTRLSRTLNGTTVNWGPTAEGLLQWAPASRLGLSVGLKYDHYNRLSNLQTSTTWLVGQANVAVWKNLQAVAYIQNDHTGNEVGVGGQLMF